MSQFIQISIRFFILLLIFPLTGNAQTAILKGRVVDAINNEGIPFANVYIQNTTTGTTTDLEGNFELTDLKAGLYNIEASFLGYASKTLFEVELFNNRPTALVFEMEQDAKQLQEVEVKANPFKKLEETPLSIRTIGVNEIQRYPGGNRDISKVIQSLPAT